MLLFSDDYKEKGHLFYKNEWQKNENGAEIYIVRKKIGCKAM